MSTQDQDEAAPQTGFGGFSLWGLGSSVLENVTQNASGFVNAIVETDWNKELQDIQEGLRSDTQELEQQVERRLGITHAARDSSAQAEDAQNDDAAAVLTGFGRSLFSGAAEIFQQVRQKVDAEFSSLEKEAAGRKPRSALSRPRTGGAKFSRLDMQISAMQRNSATYCDEPQDAEGFAAFLDTYNDEERQAEAEQIMASNPFMSELHSRLVPLVISDDTFWQRYFFRLHALKSEVEKRHQRLQQAHRHAGDDAGEEPLDSQLSLDDGSARPESPAAHSAPDKATTAARADSTSEFDVKSKTAPVADSSGAVPQGEAAPEELSASAKPPAKSLGAPEPHVAPTAAAKQEDKAVTGDGDENLPPASPEKSPAQAEAQEETEAKGSSVPDVDAAGHVDEGHSASSGDVEARSHSSGNAVSASEWSMVSRSQAPPFSGHAAGPMEPVASVAEEAADEEEVNFDDLDSELAGEDVAGVGGEEDDDDEEVDENWAQWD